MPEVAPRARSSADLLPDDLPLPAGSGPSLPTEIQEQLFGILRASLDASLVPLLAKQQQLESRLEALRKQPAATPLTTGAMAPMRSMSPSIPIDVASGSISPPPSAKPSVVATSYGFVTTPSTAPRPRRDLDLSNVGPIEMPDFGTNRAGRVLVFLLLGGVVAAIIATILSHT